MNIKGIDINHLIYELCQGIRLPNPPFCPEGICDLLKHCFLEDPDKRPNFREIKEDLLAEYDTLVLTTQSNANTSGNEIENPYASVMPLNKMKDDTMKERYSNMKMGNKKRNRKKSFTQDDEKIVEVNESVSAVKYTSLTKTVT